MTDHQDDSVAVLQNMLHSSCIVMPCHKCRAINAAIAALSPQGSEPSPAPAQQVVTDHSQCKFSTGICGTITAGTGVLSDLGYWEYPCFECALRANWQDAESRVDEAETKLAALQSQQDGAQGGEAVLVEFFRGEGQRFGLEGDAMGWSPERTAIEVMRRGRYYATPQATPAAVDDAMVDSIGSALYVYWKDVTDAARNTYRKKIRAALTAALAPQSADVNCNCASGRGAEHCIVHAPSMGAEVKP